jgi:hypothetical protein
MRTITRFFAIALIALSLGSAFTLTGCYAEEYRDDHGHLYRHERWNGEHVYLREDGRWHARRNGQWVVVEGVNIN